MHYDLSHLTQHAAQDVLGPVQDDEALLLYAACRVIGARRVIEFGGLHGYSARNFLRAVGAGGIVYSVDCCRMDVAGPGHRVITKEAAAVAAADFDGEPVDLVFFDCHNAEQQLTALATLTRAEMVTARTILAVHDTGTHPERIVWRAKQTRDGWVHAEEQRALAKALAQAGWQALHLHAPSPRPPVRFRHGLTLFGRLQEWTQ